MGMEYDYDVIGTNIGGGMSIWVKHNIKTTIGINIRP